MKQSEFKKANETIAGEVTKGYKAIETGVADCQPKRTPVPYSADSTRHN